MLKNFNYFVWELEEQDSNQPNCDNSYIKKLLYKADYALLQERLNMVKNKMAHIDSKTIMKYYPLDKLKYILRNKYNIPYVTNAWLKTYEIFFNLKDIIFTQPEVYIFFNANAPGTSSEAVKYLVDTMPNVKLYWVASTMVDKQNGTVLGDTYGLIKKSIDHWLMHKGNNGDVTDVDNITNIIKQIRDIFNRLVDVYFSDIAIDIGTDYNNEELLESKQVLGQNIIGLMCLNINGVYIIKRRGMLLPISIWFLGLLYSLFNKVQIIKPYASKPCNSEQYIIGIGFKGISQVIIDKLLSILVGFNIKSTPYKISIPIDISVQFML